MFRNSSQENKHYIIFTYSQTNTNLHIMLETIAFFNIRAFFYKLKSGLLIGSPLSRVLVCLFLEFLGSGSFKFLIS